MIFCRLYRHFQCFRFEKLIFTQHSTNKKSIPKVFTFLLLTDSCLPRPNKYVVCGQPALFLFDCIPYFFFNLRLHFLTTWRKKNEIVLKKKMIEVSFSRIFFWRLLSSHSVAKPAVLISSCVHQKWYCHVVLSNWIMLIKFYLSWLSFGFNLNRCKSLTLSGVSSPKSMSDSMLFWAINVVTH